jgi:hypothetical protein
MCHDILQLSLVVYGALLSVKLVCMCVCVCARVHAFVFVYART